MITASGLRKVYRTRRREVVAVDGVDLDVGDGEVFGVLGRSGAGKSTLLRCVNLLERPTSGTVTVDGEEMTRLRGDGLRRARRRIGMIHQHFALLSARTVAGNVAFPLEIAGMPAAKRRTRVAELLDLVGLDGLARAHSAQLSGGQKQRVGIARALAAEPRLLLSDEATSALDPETTASILDLLRRVNRELGLTILLITHEMDVIKNVCDSAAIMEAGRIIESGKLRDLLVRPGSRLADRLFPLPEASGPGIVTVTYVDRADRPLMSDLTRRYDVDVNVLGGAIETVAGAPVGRLRMRVAGARTDEALDHLRGEGLLVEVDR